MSDPSAETTVAELVQKGWGDHRPGGLRHEGGSFTRHETVAAAAARAALLADLLPPGVEPHVGLLLDNVPEYPFWLAAAALSGATAVGVNPTRRGPELARDIVHTECALLVTDRAHLPLLTGLELPGVRILVTGEPAYAQLLAPYEGAGPGAAVLRPPEPGRRMLLTFTSGSTGAPKAVVVSQGRLAAAGSRLAADFRVRPSDTHYLCMPLFHGNAVIAGWLPALAGGAGVALARRFSASRFLADVRKYEATYFTYVGRAVQYLLATPEAPDDADNPLRLGFGTEAGPVDAARFRRRFGAPLVEGYGSSEGGAAIQYTPDAPPGAVGRPADGSDLAVVDPATGRECPRARLDPSGRLLNGDEAIGELVNRGRSVFEGYWNNEEAARARTRGGWYWTGDLFFRDRDGFCYFAGRAEDRIRVDGENLAAAVIENILAGFPGTLAAAVYGVPDPVSGDQVMATLALEGRFDPEAFTDYLAGRADLGTKAAPRFVRVTERIPVTATGKVRRAALRREGFRCRDEVWWTPLADTGNAGVRYVRLRPDDERWLLDRYHEHGRADLLGR